MGHSVKSFKWIHTDYCDRWIFISSTWQKGNPPKFLLCHIWNLLSFFPINFTFDFTHHIMSSWQGLVVINICLSQLFSLHVFYIFPRSGIIPFFFFFLQTTWTWRNERGQIETGWNLAFLQVMPLYILAVACSVALQFSTPHTHATEWSVSYCQLIR